jgi:hypothetical protein
MYPFEIVPLTVDQPSKIYYADTLEQKQGWVDKLRAAAEVLMLYCEEVH